MTTKQTPAQSLEPQAISPEAAINESTPEATGEPSSKPVIPAFKFPFSPATFAPGKSDNQAWHGKGHKSAHEKKIGPAPNGTRRSMGKR